MYYKENTEAEAYAGPCQSQTALRKLLYSQFLLAYHFHDKHWNYLYLFQNTGKTPFIYDMVYLS